MDSASELIETSEALASFYSSEHLGIRWVKPRVFFRTVEEVLGIPINLTLRIPSSEIGSITMLEAAILCSILRLLQPKSVLEIGTYLGYSTRMFLENTDDFCEITSVDLPSEFDVTAQAATYSDTEIHEDDTKNDDYLRLKQRIIGSPYLAGLDRHHSSRLHLIKSDSRELTPAALGGYSSVDFAFIDGGHDEGTVASDTRLASDLISSDGVIVWHDFESSIHHDVSAEIRSLANRRKIIAVTNTLLAIEFRGNARAVFEKAGR